MDENVLKETTDNIEKIKGEMLLEKLLMEIKQKKIT